VATAHELPQCALAPGAFDPGAIRCVGLLAAPHKHRIGHALRTAAEWFAARGIRVRLSAEQAVRFGLPEAAVERPRLAEECDLLISMGGDGTLLSAARLAAPRGKPVLGVNFGGFGFLAAIPQNEMLARLAEVLGGRFRMSERMMIEARVQRDKETVGAYIALNDIVVGKGAISRLFRLTTAISGEPISEFPADGMIVSTPTGSTGYALSAGGPVVDPEVRLLLITPICAHTLSARSVVVPASRTVEISLTRRRGEDIYLTADGQEGMSLLRDDRVQVREAPFCARLIGLEGDTFYAKLRAKLGWGGQR
jgi:NAD+ kinase